MHRPMIIALLGLAIAAGCGPTGAGTSATPAASASSGSAAPAVSQAPVIPATQVTVKDFAIVPADVRVGAGTVTLAVTNDGPTIHNVTIRDPAGATIVATKDLKEGQAETISAEMKPGTYVLFCSLPGHESLGTKASLEVGP